MASSRSSIGSSGAGDAGSECDMRYLCGLCAILMIIGGYAGTSGFEIPSALARPKNKVKSSAKAKAISAQLASLRWNRNGLIASETCVIAPGRRHVDNAKQVCFESLPPSASVSDLTRVLSAQQGLGRPASLRLEPALLERPQAIAALTKAAQRQGLALSFEGQIDIKTALDRLAPLGEGVVVALVDVPGDKLSSLRKAARSSALKVAVKANETVDDRGLSQLKGLKRLTSLNLSYTKVTDKGLVHIKGLKRLTRLSLQTRPWGHVKITDAGLVHIKGLKRLTRLDLSRTQVTSAGLVHIKGLTKLSSLGLNGEKLVRSDVTDAGLVHIKQLKDLTNLGLSYTKVTDAGLRQLKGLKRLMRLELSGTKVTNTGLAEFKRHLPGCSIEILLLMRGRACTSGDSKN